jgi:hypothetical protein
MDKRTRPRWTLIARFVCLEAIWDAEDVVNDESIPAARIPIPIAKPLLNFRKALTPKVKPVRTNA